VEALKERIKETKIKNQQLLIDQRVNQAATRRLQSELNRADQKLEAVLVGSGPHNSIYLETIRQMRKLRIKVHDLQQTLKQRDKKIEDLLQNERQSHVMELEVQNQEFYGQIVYLRAALQQRDETIRKEQLSSLATVEASYRLADDVTSLQIAKRKVEDELHQTRAQLDRAISITNKDGSVVSVFDLIEELQAKLRVQKEQNAKLRTEAQRFRSYLQREEVASAPERRKRTLKTKQKQAMERLTTLPGWKDKLTPDISGHKTKRWMKSPTKSSSPTRRDINSEMEAAADLKISLATDGSIEIGSPKNDVSGYQVDTPSAMESPDATLDDGDDDGGAGDDDGGDDDGGDGGGDDDGDDDGDDPAPSQLQPSPEVSPKPEVDVDDAPASTADVDTTPKPAADKDDGGGFDEDDGDGDGGFEKEDEPAPKPAPATSAAEKDDDGGFDDDDDDDDDDGAFEKDDEPTPKPAADKGDDDGFDDDDDDDGGFEKEDEPAPKPAADKPAAKPAADKGDDDDGFDDDDDDGDDFEKDDEPTPKPAPKKSSC